MLWLSMIEAEFNCYNAKKLKIFFQQSGYHIKEKEKFYLAGTIRRNVKLPRLPSVIDEVGW